MPQQTPERLRVADRATGSQGTAGSHGAAGSQRAAGSKRAAAGRAAKIRAAKIRAAVSRAAGPRPAGRAAPLRVRVTVRGALVALFALCLTACLIASWRQFDTIAGLAYCAGCLAAPVYVKREAQLRVVIAPPLVFLLAVVLAQALTAQGSSGHGSALSVLEGTFLMLAATAPWLIAGTAAGVGMAMFRGLPDCVREFRDGFRGEHKSGSWHRA
jgi:hypothetical protein